jgi:hypothetical protein
VSSIVRREQEFVDRYLVRAVEEFDSNPLSVRIIRRLAREHPNEFAVAALRYLDSDVQTNAHRFLTVLIIRLDAIFDQLSDPALRTKEVATRLLRRILDVDPAFDVQLARKLPDRTGVNHSVAFDSVRAGRTLDLLDETSRGGRLLSILGHLPNSTDSRISARAVLFVGRRVQSAEWAQQQLNRADPRARANVVEAIWGVASRQMKTLLECCVGDSCNRVVGNALIGLHLYGETNVIPAVSKLALRGEALFRTTAAWTMGRIGDPVCRAPLQLLLRDAEPKVRGAALRAMIQVHRKEVDIPAEAVTAAQPETHPVQEHEEVGYSFTRENIQGTGTGVSLPGASYHLRV